MTKGRPKNTGDEERAPLSPEHVAFGKRLAQLRGERSQREVARLANVNNGTISDLENGYTDPKLSTLVQIARAICVPVADIIGSQHERSRLPADSSSLDCVSRDDRLSVIEARLGALSERVSAQETRHSHDIQQQQTEIGRDLAALGELARDRSQAPAPRSRRSI